MRTEEAWNKGEILIKEMESLPEGIKKRLAAEKAKIPETLSKYPKKSYAVEEGATITRKTSIGLAEGTEQLSEAQILSIQQYDKSVQRAMIKKAYGDLEPKATIGGKPTTQISEAEKEEVLEELAGVTEEAIPAATIPSKKDYSSLSYAQKSELDRQIHEYVFKDVGEVPVQVPLTQEDWLGIDRYNIEVQRAMKEKAYGKLEPTATKDGKPVIPISEAEK